MPHYGSEQERFPSQKDSTLYVEENMASQCLPTAKVSKASPASVTIQEDVDAFMASEPGQDFYQVDDPVHGKVLRSVPRNRNSDYSDTALNSIQCVGSKSRRPYTTLSIAAMDTEESQVRFGADRNPSQMRWPDQAATISAVHGEEKDLEDVAESVPKRVQTVNQRSLRAGMMIDDRGYIYLSRRNHHPSHTIDRHWSRSDHSS